MFRILLLIDHEENRRMLAEALAGSHQVLAHARDGDLDGDYDLAIVGGHALDRLRDSILARKAREDPLFLPFLLVSSRSDVGLASSALWQVVDDVMTMPVARAELQARMALLLRTRALSLELQRRNDDLQMFVQALGHDLRAPTRFALGFSLALREDYAESLDHQARHYLDRIDHAMERISDFLDLLLAYALMGQRSVISRPVPLDSAVRAAVGHLQDSIAAAGAVVRQEGSFPVVLADPEMLDLALNNLLTNAIKFVAPGTRPEVTISARTEDGAVWLEVADNGVGIPSESQKRIFEPLVRLYGEESYEGAGLGLAIVQRAVALMGGVVEVTSAPGEGSTFGLRLSLEGGMES